MKANTARIIKRQSERWYPLIDHPVQLRLVSANDRGVRFPLVPAGRRSGKTERAKRRLVKSAYKHPGLYFAAAPTHDQAKKIWWKDLKDLCIVEALKRKPSESERVIYLPNESEIYVIGLDKPQRIEGTPWAGGMIDEFADIKPNAWEEHILPALNTVNPTNPDYLAWCWLLGVPDGLNHYYDLCELAETGEDEDFEVFTWHSADILDKLHPGLIEKQKAKLSSRQFRQEYEASFETATGRVYEEYSRLNHTQEKIAPHEQLLWMHDFNFTPMSSAIGVIRDYNHLYLLDEVILTSAVAKQSALEFVNRYKDHQNRKILLFGDPAGRAGEKHSHGSDYVDIEKVLRANNWQVERQVRPKAPAIVDRQNAVNAKICNAVGERTLFVNPQAAKYCHKGLSTLQLMPGSSFQEKVTDYQHVTTAIGYCVERIWPVRHDIEEEEEEFHGRTNYW